MHYTSPVISNPFKHRSVQNLAWVLYSAPLIAGRINNTTWLDMHYFTQEYQHCYPLLKKLDQQPDALIAHLNCVKSPRLGLHFEALIAYWLHISPHYEVLYQNYALHHAGRTHGEMDFIVREISTDKIIHLEVAVKFYLGNGDFHAMNNWHGPNRQDRLDKKYQRLVQHQTQLTRKYPELMPCAIDESWCLLKGRLFYPPSISETGKARFATAAHSLHHWVTPHQTQHRSNTPNITSADTLAAPCYQALDKRDWLAPLTKQLALLRKLPGKPEQAQCFIHWQQNKEDQRFFLIPDDFWQLTETTD